MNASALRAAVRRVARLAEQLDRLLSELEAADDVPPLVMARALLGIHRAAGRLEAAYDRLAAVSALVPTPAPAAGNGTVSVQKGGTP
jgi:hypothetical protein